SSDVCSSDLNYQDGKNQKEQYGPGVNSHDKLCGALPWSVMNRLFTHGCVPIDISPGECCVRRPSGRRSSTKSGSTPAIGFPGRPPAPNCWIAACGRQ